MRESATSCVYYKASGLFFNYSRIPWIMARAKIYNMKRFGLVLLFLLVIQKLLAQSTFAPEGAYWNYNYMSHSGGMYANWTIAVTNDSIINGYPTKTLTKFYDIYYSLPPNPSPGQGIEAFGTLQMRNDSVFYYYSYPYDEKYLFSFNLDNNDTIPIENMGQSLFAVVDSMSYVIINNDTLKKWYLTKYCDTTFFGQATIIENIGPIDDYLLWNKDGCPIGGGGWSFLCYSSSSLNYNTPCYPVSADKNKKDDKELISVYPNPFSNKLKITSKIDFGESTLTIKDISMQVVFEQLFSENNTIELDLSSLPASYYFLQFRNKDKIICKPIIKL